MSSIEHEHETTKTTLWRSTTLFLSSNDELRGQLLLEPFDDHYTCVTLDEKMIDESPLIFQHCDGSFLMRIVQLYGETLFPTYLDPYGFNLVIGKGYSLVYLQEIAFQHPMKCKGRNLIWEGGSLHWRSTKMEHGQRHPHLDEWVWMVSKRLVSHLHIYDTGQQEAWLHWLLLKEFGQHVTYPSSKGMLVEETWQGTCIIWQQEFGCIMLIWHSSYQSSCFHLMIRMMEVWGGSKRYCCFGYSWESMGRNFPILGMLFPQKGMAQSKCKEATLQHWRIRRYFHVGRRFPHIAAWWWINLGDGMSKKGVMEWKEPYH